MLEFIPNQIWIKQIPLRFFGLQIGARMTVVRLSHGRLFVHSPVTLDEQTKAQLDRLGRVTDIVSPNKLHHLFIGDYFDAYPNARIFASPGLPEKRKDLTFRYVLKDTPEIEWQEELDQTIFYGHPLLQEVVFFHRQSRTLLVADLIMYFDEQSSPLTRLVTKMFGMYQKAVPPADFQASLSKTMQARISVEKILEWDFEKIILSHGRLIEKDGKAILKEAFSWLFD